MNHTESGSRLLRSPTAHGRLAAFLNDWDMFGWMRALQHAAADLLTQSRDNFDAKYGVSTAGRVAPSEAEIGDPVAFENAHDYMPTEEEVMRHILRYLSRYFDATELTFVDVGCGKGRALLLAAELPFKEVVGVEISASHCRIAEENVARRFGSGTPCPKPRPWQGGRLAQRSSIRVCHCDATQFDFPAGDLVVYLFNPFRGRVLRAVLDRLAAVATKHCRIHVVLSCPRSERLLHDHPAFSKQHEFRAISIFHSWSLWRCDSQSERSATTAPNANVV